jgi:nicotinamide-nucleotide adenylyltransferase
MSRAFYIGRFQPYHNGHQSVLEWIAEREDEIIIGVGTAQLSHEPVNPFTAGERVLMIHAALQDLDCPVYVIPIEDLHRNTLWVSHVRSMPPPFEHIYSSNPLVMRLFEEEGLSVQSPSMHAREIHSGTEVRRRMIAGEDWECLVPPSVVRVIHEIDGVGRLCQIARNDCDTG